MPASHELPPHATSSQQQPQYTPQLISKERQILPQQQTNAKPVINPSYSNLVSNTNSFKITASAAPTVAKLISNIAASTSATPSASTAASSSSSNTVNVNLSAGLLSANKMCYICLNKTATSVEPMITCSSCQSHSHPHCLELNPDLVNWPCIRQYAWECMECKKCSVCSTPHDDDKMMFCDRCDRGFHTYCVNVDQVPSGAWLCKNCTICNEQTAAANEDEKIIKEFCSSNQFDEAKLMDTHVLLNNISKSPLFKQALKSEPALATPPNVLTGRAMKIKDRLASSSASIDSLPSSMSGAKRFGRGRGRPPGSLNKPKDPNSPKKSA